MPPPAVPPEMRAAIVRLCRLDPDLGDIEATCGALPWRSRPPGFAGLLQAITAQQISNQAAHVIWTRLRAVPDALTPGGLLAAPEEALRAAGLSRPKVAHARALADACASGRLDLDAVANMDDAAAVAAITAVRGIGPWTAEVYLLFALGRPDVFPAGDVALQAAAAGIKRLATRPDARALRSIAAAWQPWRALAARLLWHHWRHVTGRPAMDDIVGP